MSKKSYIVEFEEHADPHDTRSWRGKVKEARGLLAQIPTRRDSAYALPTSVAKIHVALGDHDEAMRWLQRGLADHDPYRASLKVEPDFQPLRSDRRFKALLKKLKLE